MDADGKSLTPVAQALDDIAWLTLHRDEGASLSRERLVFVFETFSALSEIVAEAGEMLAAQNQLLARYRCGMRPSGKLLDKLAGMDAILARIASLQPNAERGDG